MRGQPVEVLGLGFRAADNEVRAVGQPRYRDIGLDAAALIQPLGVNQVGSPGTELEFAL